MQESQEWACSMASLAWTLPLILCLSLRFQVPKRSISFAKLSHMPDLGLEEAQLSLPRLASNEKSYFFKGS